MQCTTRMLNSMQNNTINMHMLLMTRLNSNIINLLTAKYGQKGMILEITAEIGLASFGTLPKMNNRLHHWVLLTETIEKHI